MELVMDFEKLSKKILEKYKNEICVTIGILIADYRQDEAKQYILNYMDHFDKLSGKYIDFYLPGYYMFTEDSKDEWEKRQHYNMCVSRHCSAPTPIYIDRTGAPYYFDDYLFEDFLREFRKRTGIRYTYNPMLVLVEVQKERYGGQIQFQDRIVIELDENTPRGVKRSGQLFEAIFEIAMQETHLDRFGRALKIKY